MISCPFLIVNNIRQQFLVLVNLIHCPYFVLLNEASKEAVRLILFIFVRFY